MQDFEKVYFDHIVQINVESGRTYDEAVKVCKGFQKNHPEAWKDAMDAWFDEVHPY